MSLWVKRTGQLLIAALFLMACEDEASLLGFRNPNKKFNARYIDIPLESGVYRLDSIRTSSIFVGEHTDPQFGTFKTIAYSQLRSFTASEIDANAVVDSVFLDLRFDYYSYGGIGTSTQTFEIHEVDEILYPDSTYLSKTSVLYSPTVLGTASYAVNPDYFREQLEKADSEKDTTTIRFILDTSFGQKLVANDTIYNDFTAFTQYIKGLAIVPVSNDQIVGFDMPNSLDAGSNITKLVVHYHTFEADSLEQTFLVDVAGFGVQFTEIQSNFSGNLTSLTNFYQEDPALTASDFRYAQIGTGIVTKLDFTNFLNFSDTIPNLIINSAELHLSNLESESSYEPINDLSLIVVKEDNRLRSAIYDQNTTINGEDTIYYFTLNPADQEEINRYDGRVVINSGQNDISQVGKFTAIGDANSVFYLSKSGSDNSYSGFFTLLMQQLYIVKRTGEQPFTKFALYPSTPIMGRGLDRMIFNKNNIKLRVYYTIPTVTD